MPMLSDLCDVVIGVDTHKQTHTAAVVSATTTGVLATLTVPATTRGYEQLLELGDPNRRRVWSIEGTASYGSGLTRFLQGRGERVIEMDHPNRNKRRNGVKNDEVDAIRAAREALGRDKLAEPRGPGQRAALAALLATRASAVESAKQARTQLQSLLVTAPEALRERLAGRKGAALLVAAAIMEVPQDKDTELQALSEVVRCLGRRALALYEEAKAHETSIRAIVQAWRPGILGQRGVGPIVGATVLCAWSHPGRFGSEAGFAMLAGVAPLDASTGQSPRQRLSRNGDRHLNRAIHTVVITRWRSDEATIAYCARRRLEGKSDREIRRCLKRYIARSLFRLLEAATDGGSSRQLDKKRDLTNIGASIWRRWRGRSLGPVVPPPTRW